ncbi:hypothetical protein D3C81_1761070 [compost metagenome]
MAGIKLGHHRLGTDQVVGIGLPLIDGSGRQAHGFQIGGKEAIPPIQRQHDRRGYDHTIADSRRYAGHRMFGTPQGNAGEQGEAQQGQRQGERGATHNQTKRLRCRAHAASARKAPA